MPARQPFTNLCRNAARGAAAGRADLHVHTTRSDGEYTPAQVIDLARRSGLAAVAITDHDTVAGLADGRTAASGTGVEMVAGVEISAEDGGREHHILGYFFRPDEAGLTAAMNRLRLARVARFREMVGRLRGCGLAVDDEEVQPLLEDVSPGRRHLAVLLVKARRVGSVREAFVRYLGDGGRVAVPKVRLAVHEAVAVIRGAGGVAALAHPTYDCSREQLRALRDVGLGALEVEYPGTRASRGRELRAWAAELGLAVTGGSDCHGPGHPRRAVGAAGISAAELEALRLRACG
jgi:predicted metal-dependent phosphoesterase TrpH